MTLDPTDRALLRGWLQGLPWLVLSDVYLPESWPRCRPRRCASPSN